MPAYTVKSRADGDRRFATSNGPIDLHAGEKMTPVVLNDDEAAALRATGEFDLTEIAEEQADPAPAAKKR